MQGLRATIKFPIEIIGNPAENRSEHLLNASQERDYYVVAPGETSYGRINVFLYNLFFTASV